MPEACSGKTVFERSQEFQGAEQGLHIRLETRDPLTLENAHAGFPQFDICNISRRFEVDFRGKNMRPRWLLGHGLDKTAPSVQAGSSGRALDPDSHAFISAFRDGMEQHGCGARFSTFVCPGNLAFIYP